LRCQRAKNEIRYNIFIPEWQMARCAVAQSRQHCPIVILNPNGAKNLWAASPAEPAL